MPYSYWPLFDLVVATRDLVLTPVTETDLARAADLLPPDVELDPAATRYELSDERLQRGIVTHQHYWTCYGTWNPLAWRLPFAVRRDGEYIGCQELEGTDFPTLRSVDSSSYLVGGARGHGLGKQMRQAVLALAFGPLGARAAVTSAWRDNDSSLGVSRALGYRPNGETLHRRGEDVDVMVHMRLTRADWLATGADEQVRISGFEPCHVLFGLVGG